MKKRSGIKILTGVCLLATIAGCAEVRESTPRPALYQSLASATAQIDSTTVASMINLYRQNNGLPPLTVETRLMNAAQVEANLMADRARHEKQLKPEAPLKQRLLAKGYQAKTSHENTSAGYHTWAEAFSGWRESPKHRATLLAKNVNHLGIATSYVPFSKYKVQWVLITASE